MRVKPGFSYLSWLVFLVYLLFGLGGNLVSACCAETDPTEACLSLVSVGETPADLALLDRSDDHCSPCLDHCQASSPEQFHLAGRQLASRVQSPLPSPLFLARQLPDRHAAAGIFLEQSSPAQNSVLRVLRSTVLLI